MTPQNCALIIFAKAPIPGQVKTRLAQTIGDQAAARLATHMLHDTLHRAIAARVGPVELCCAPDTTHREFRHAAAQYDISLTMQGGGDLGERMYRALERALLRHPCALLIGTDAPALGIGQLRRAADALLTNPAVFVPATDGGYVLVGMNEPMLSLFDDIPWSTAGVMQRTRERIVQLGIDVAELEPVADVDIPDDLKHVPAEWLA
ncbi:TIGR04282 family arsenosugar biosynthesis glycosyltransferase [Noviherbaspirillum sp.]|uniref:TIGR04282 family arsenosugar biosynthesis glycosyltransferase n=1 Tax=Noviherbaspirillum sp. TaxID=1926288 RepID=UPI002FE1F037